MSCFWLYLRNCIFCISWPLPEALSLSCHQCLCLQHHWWPGAVSVPDVAGIFAGGPRVVGAIATPSVTLFEGPPHHWCQVPCGCRCRCIQEARVTGTTPRGTTRGSGAMGSVAPAMGVGSASLPLLFPWFHLLYVKNLLSFRCTTVCISGGLTCWVEKSLVMGDVIYKL